ncbi:ribosome maturation factor RimM [Aliidongia dinghuensis]|uniref:Ribosome maturation factor RimM n=1 Tax=Aliidongia dinghuensis TaxID=1867774 RepID=A0A8J2YZD7_9PROT|nr:ribosome maturation factor RimM [Aliidongia dinghuensis]GGF45759.1 ribosome maturation factor RimM [Aliidongia dinghuensis]
MSAPSKRLCVGIVTGAQGIRGAVRIKSFTADPIDIDAYGPVSDEAGTRTFTLKSVGQSKGVVVATLSGVTDRNAAEALRGLHLFVDRDRLPPADEEEYYHADLLGLAAELVGGQALGRITAVYDFGAGDALEVTGADGAVVMVPFTKAAVPVVDLAAGKVVIDPPAGLFEKPEPPQPLEQQAALAGDPS